MIAAVATTTVGVATTIAVAGTNHDAMIQVAELEATAARAVAGLSADRRAITVQRPCVAAPTATVVIIAEIAPSIVQPEAFALRMADVIEAKTKIAAVIRAATRARTKIATKIAAVIRAATRAGTKIVTKIRIAVAIVAGIEIAIATKIA
jgi:hypothetical protein